MSSKISRNACLTSAWAWVGTVARRLRQRCTRQRCRRLWAKTTSMAPISPGAPSVSISSGDLSPRSTSSPRKLAQGHGLVGAGCQPDQQRTALDCQAQAHSTGSARAPGCIREWDPSRNRYSSSIPPRSQCFQASTWVLIARRRAPRSTSTAPPPDQRFGQRGLHVADRQARTNPDSTSASSALVRDPPLPSSRDTTGWSVPRSLGRSSTTGPAVVLTVCAAWPLWYPARSRSPRLPRRPA
jgi:hypothetical protein